VTKRLEATRFATTHWSVVHLAGRDQGSQARAALSELCEIYWYPIYAYVRRRGYAPPDAQDLTQAFFTRLIEKHDFTNASPERGRFRSYLVASMMHFIANDRAWRRRLKRGGGVVHLGLELETAEHRYTLEPRDEITPEDLFVRRWALTVLDRTMAALRNSYSSRSKGDLFDRLQPLLTGEADASHETLGHELGMNEGAVKVAMHRLRRRFGTMLREEIARTVSSEEEIDEEIRLLLEAIRRQR